MLREGGAISTDDAGRVLVTHRAHVGEAERLCARVAHELGFDETATAELRIVARELATNQIRHANGGQIRVERTEGDGRPGLQIVAEDGGAGIVDLEVALTDGYSTDGGSGSGLGAVQRLTDELTVTSGRPTGGVRSRIVARRWLQPERAPATAAVPGPEIGVATRACPGERVNGDGFVVQRWEDRLLVGVLDGLGHGAFAHRASATARRVIERHHARRLDELFRRVSRECRATRGLVMALARFDLTAGTFRFASVGNIEARMIHPDTRADLMVRRGVLGRSAPMPRITTNPWLPGSWLILHSDGIASRWQPADFPSLWLGTAQEAAGWLLRHRASDSDDATVVVVKDPGTVGGDDR